MHAVLQLLQHLTHVLKYVSSYVRTYIYFTTCAVVTGTDNVYSRVGTSRHAETLKKLKGDISQPSTELGFHDVTDEWKGWVLTAPDDTDADNE